MPSDDSATISVIADLQHYKVGGAVRDRVLGIPSRDADWVVVGSTPEAMSKLGFRKIGKDFPVFLHPQNHEQYALARRERKVGRGYKGFEVDVGGDVTLEEDLYRRDLTINAMAEAPDGAVIDPYGGRRDIENRVLRHVSRHFVEDPLRVVRVARFVSQLHQFGFSIDSSTLSLMKQMVAGGELEDLVAERVWQEIEVALVHKAPEMFFFALHECGALAVLIPEFESLFAGDKGADKWAVEALRRAAGLTGRFDIRFAVLAYCAGVEHGGGAESMVGELCTRLRTPAYCKSLALQLVRHCGTMRRFRQSQVHDVIELVHRLDGMRNPGHMHDFLIACRAILQIDADETGQAYEDGDRLVACRDAMATIDAKALAEKYRGEQLREQIQEAQVYRVAETLSTRRSYPDSTTE